MPALIRYLGRGLFHDLDLSCVYPYCFLRIQEDQRRTPTSVFVYAVSSFSRVKRKGAFERAEYADSYNFARAKYHLDKLLSIETFYAIQ